MRKMHARTRRMRRSDEASGYNSLAFLNTLAASAPFDAGPMPGINSSSQTVAVRLAIQVHDALKQLHDHTAEPDDHTAFNTLAQAVDVAAIRTLQIDPTDAAGHMPDLDRAKAAMETVRARYIKLHRWGMTMPEREALTAAVDLYEAILMSSSPAQMMKAEDIRIEGLLKQVKK